MLCGMTASGGFLVVSGERWSNYYSFIPNHCLLHLSLMKENFCFREIFFSTNVTFRSISCLVSGRFASEGYQYGIYIYINAAQNNSDSLLSCHPDNHHSSESDDVYWRKVESGSGYAEGMTGDTSFPFQAWPLIWPL